MKIEFKFDIGQTVWWRVRANPIFVYKGEVKSVIFRGRESPVLYEVAGFSLKEEELFPTVKELRKTELEGLVSKLGKQLAEAEMELAKLKEEDKGL